MLKKIKQFISKIFGINMSKCDDEEPIVLKEVVKEIIHPCPIHKYFKAKCHMCVAHANGINL